MLIYIDTMVWNRLCDEGADPKGLVSGLASRGAQLVIGTEAIYELAKTFRAGTTEAHSRGTRLFTYLREFVKHRVPCLSMNPTILAGEVDKVTGEQRNVPLLLEAADYRKMDTEVQKLSMGIFEPAVDAFIKKTDADAARGRAQLINHIERLHPNPKGRISEIDQDQLADWIRKEVGRIGQQLIRERLNWHYRLAAKRDLSFVAKKLMASSSYRLAHALVRADLYMNWRCVRNATIPRDLMFDADHMVNASYCDVYATLESGQAKYGSIVLTKTRFAACDCNMLTADWLLSL